MGTVAGLFVFVLTKGLLAQRRSPVTGRSSLIGADGVARTDLEPEGTVFVQGEYWKGRSVSEPIPHDARVVVTGVEGRRLLVRRETESGDENRKV